MGRRSFSQLSHVTCTPAWKGSHGDSASLGSRKYARFSRVDRILHRLLDASTSPYHARASAPRGDLRCAEIALLAAHDPPSDATTLVPPGVTAVEIFEAAPYLRPLMRPGSIIDLFYNETNAAGTRPMRYHGQGRPTARPQGRGDGVRAAARAARHRIWADADVELRGAGAAFLRFVAAHDVSTCLRPEETGPLGRAARRAVARRLGRDVPRGRRRNRPRDEALGLGGGCCVCRRADAVTGNGKSIPPAHRVAGGGGARLPAGSPPTSSSTTCTSGRCCSTPPPPTPGPLPPSRPSSAALTRRLQGWLAYNFSRQRVMLAGRRCTPTLAAPGATADGRPSTSATAHHIQTGPYSAVRNVQERVHNRTAKMGRLESWLRIPGSGFVAGPMRSVKLE